MIKVHDKRVCAVLEFLRSAKNGCVELKFTANKAHAQRAQRGPSIQYMYNQGAFSLRSVCCPTLQGYIAHKQTPTSLAPPYRPTVRS